MTKPYRKRPGDERVSSARRGYGRDWQKARAQFLKDHPLCRDHFKRGELKPATVVDHVVPHRGDVARFWDRSNWQSLCSHCHDSHKQRLERSGRVAGCDENGVPLDPAHPWRASS